MNGINHLAVTTTTKSTNPHRDHPLVILLHLHPIRLRGLNLDSFQGKTVDNPSIRRKRLLAHLRGCLPILRIAALPVVGSALGENPAKLERLVDHHLLIGIIPRGLLLVAAIRIIVGGILLVVTAALLVVDAGVGVLPGDVLLDIGTIRLLGAILRGTTDIAGAETAWGADVHAVAAIVVVLGANLPTRPFGHHLLILRKQEPGTGAGLQVRVCMSVRQSHLVLPRARPPQPLLPQFSLALMSLPRALSLSIWWEKGARFVAGSEVVLLSRII